LAASNDIEGCAESVGLGKTDFCADICAIDLSDFHFPLIGAARRSAD